MVKRLGVYILMALVLSVMGIQASPSQAATGTLEASFVLIRDTLPDTMMVSIAITALNTTNNFSETQAAMMNSAASSIMDGASSETMTFAIFPMPAGNAAPVWTETHNNVPVADDGSVHLFLGSVEPLASGLLEDGVTRFLQVSVGANVLTPRIALVTAKQVLLVTGPVLAAESDGSPSATWTSGLDAPGATVTHTTPLPTRVRTSAIFGDPESSPYKFRQFDTVDIPASARVLLQSRGVRAFIRKVPPKKLPD